jgi:hypothetical protein
MENREVALYAIYGGSNYQQFATKSLEDIALGVKTSAATDYTLSVSEVSGSKTLKLKIGDETIDLTEGLSKALTLTPNQDALAFGTLEPSAPSEPGICFNYEKLQITGYDGAQVELLNYADKSSVFVESVSGDNVEIDLQTKGLTANTQYFVKLSPAAGEAKEYVIKFKPAVTVVP